MADASGNNPARRNSEHSGSHQLKSNIQQSSLLMSSGGGGLGPSGVQGLAGGASPSGAVPVSGRPCSGGCARWPAGQVPYIAPFGGSCGRCGGAAGSAAQLQIRRVLEDGGSRSLANNLWVSLFVRHEMSCVMRRKNTHRQSSGGWTGSSCRCASTGSGAQRLDGSRGQRPGCGTCPLGRCRCGRGSGRGSWLTW